MADVTEKTRATISITSKGQPIGEIVLRFFPDVAPGHVKNFIDAGQRRLLQRHHLSSSDSQIHDSGGDPNSKNPDRSSHGMGGPGTR